MDKMKLIDDIKIKVIGIFILLKKIIGIEAIPKHAPRVLMLQINPMLLLENFFLLKKQLKKIGNVPPISMQGGMRSK